MRLARIALAAFFFEATRYWNLRMARKRMYKSDADEAIHSAAEGMFRVGAIDEATMRSFDESCLIAPREIKPREIDHREIKALRKHHREPATGNRQLE
jgi:hypothetical protein